MNNTCPTGTSVTSSRRLARCVILTGLILFATPVCEADSADWTAEEGSNEWDALSGPIGGPYVNNWSGSFIPDADDVVAFGDDYLIGPHRTIDLRGNRSLNALYFQTAGDYTLGTTIGAETLTIGDGSLEAGVSIVSTAYGGAKTSVLNCNVAMDDASGDNTFSVYSVLDHTVVFNGIVSGTNTLEKLQVGTIVLTNANTYSGGTSVSAGTVRVSNTTGSGTGTGSVTVKAGSMLTGTGRIGGAVTVDANGVIAPGDSTGTLTALAGVILNGTYDCEIDGVSADKLAVTGTLDVTSGTLDVSELNIPNGSSYTIATATLVQGPFATVTGLRGSMSVIYNGTSIVLERNPLHVDAAAASNGSGANWGDALDTLDEALSLAEQGDEIWVKAGIYMPGQGSTDPYSTFDVPDGIQLLGGFAGTETSASERDPSAHLTVLSGDLGDDDTDKVDGITTSPSHIVGTNAYSVVTLHISASLVDGFTITGGSALVTPVNGQGEESRGGGVFVDTDFGKIPTLSNCRLYGNTAYQGGGVFIHSNGGCDIESCDFRSNSASLRGGAGYYWWSKVTTKNSNFSGNHAGYQGGAIYDDPSDKGTSLFVNCTITGNHAVSVGGAVKAETIGSSSAAMINTIIWNNSAGASPTINNIDRYAFTYCLLQNHDLTSMGGGNLDGTDAANDPGFFLPLDPGTAPSMNGEFRPAPGATILNAGDNSAILGIPLDLSGEPRIIEIVDLGAYEDPLYSAYTWWINGYFPGETDPAIIGLSADPGQNGLNNAMSFLTNTSPLATDPGQPLTMTQIDDNRFFIIPDANEGWEEFDAYLEYSFDLVHFERILLSPEQISSSTVIEPGIESIQWYIVPFSLVVDPSLHPKVFARLSVDIQ